MASAPERSRGLPCDPEDRACRRAGRTIRSLVDCMVAAAAIDEDRPLLARNRDFEMIARHTELELAEPSRC